MSYSSADRELADSIRLSLVGAGHRVFFDREDLPPGETYDLQILEAIETSDLLVFLISPDSLSPGSYALTELGFARKRWRNPHRRIIPVVVQPVDIDSLPSYLRAVTLLEPMGDVAAEVVMAVDTLGGWRRFKRNALAGSLSSVLVIGAAVIVYLLVRLDQSACETAAVKAKGAADRMLDALRNAQVDEEAASRQWEIASERKWQAIRQGFAVDYEQKLQWQKEADSISTWRYQLIEANDAKFSQLLQEGWPIWQQMVGECGAEVSPSEEEWRQLLTADKFSRERFELLAVSLGETAADLASQTTPKSGEQYQKNQ